MTHAGGGRHGDEFVDTGAAATQVPPPVRHLPPPLDPPAASTTNLTPPCTRAGYGTHDGQGNVPTGAQYQHGTGYDPATGQVKTAFGKWPVSYDPVTGAGGDSCCCC